MCRNFIWSMTSWRRGHMCQQHLTTTQPSRPSKAQSVQWLQPFCTQHCHPGGGAVVHTIGFYSLKMWLFDCRGHCLRQYCPAFPNLTICPKHPTLVLLLFSMFLLFCLVLSSSRVFVLFTSPMPVFLAKSKDWPSVRFLSLTLTDVNSQRRQR